MARAKLPFEWFNPMSWPTWARRTFLLTLPISGPLYAIIVVGFAMLIVICGLAAIPFSIFIEVWRGE